MGDGILILLESSLGDANYQVLGYKNYLLGNDLSPSTIKQKASNPQKPY